MEGAQLPFLITPGILLLMGAAALRERVSSRGTARGGYRYERWPWRVVGTQATILGSMALTWVLRRHLPQTVPFGQGDVDIVTAVLGVLAFLGLLGGVALFFWYEATGRR